MAFTFEIQPTTVVKTSFDHLHQIYKAKSYLPPKDHKKHIHRHSPLDYCISCKIWRSVPFSYDSMTSGYLGAGNTWETSTSYLFYGGGVWDG